MEGFLLVWGINPRIVATAKNKRVMNQKKL